MNYVEVLENLLFVLDSMTEEEFEELLEIIELKKNEGKYD